MSIHRVSSRNLLRSGAILACAAVAVTLSLTAAGKRPMKNLSFDPSAPSVELFAGIEQGMLDVTVIPKNALHATVFIENKGDTPVTVKLPKAVATVQVLKQGFGGGAGAAGGGLGGQGQGGGGGQAGGGGFGGGGQGGGLGGGGQGGGGGGFFSVPPQKVVQVPLNTVCLEHGKADPKPKMTYRLVPIETFTSDPVLQELVAMVGTGKLEEGAAQAAAWNVANKMSWDELSAKKIRHLGGIPPEPYFSQRQLMAAQQIVAQSQQRVRDREEDTTKESAPVRNRRPEKKS